MSAEYIQTFLPGQDAPVNLTSGLTSVQRRIYVYVYEQTDPPIIDQIAGNLGLTFGEVYEGLYELRFKNKVEIAWNGGYRITGL